ncbi:MAG: hypothetical protein OXF77_02945 [Thaumarchaeota archaeon]|nr:hypothetical protein [Nitrososphaerota archaeon]
MDESKEFTEALLDQISIETNEENEIANLIRTINEDSSFTQEFDDLKRTSNELFQKMKQLIIDFTGLDVSPNVKIQHLDLVDFKKVKGKKVHPTQRSRNYVYELFDAISNNNFDKIVCLINNDISKFLVYSTYAKSYISKISTTYGDYYDSTIYINKFILNIYPKIILYKYGKPYNLKFESVRSAYFGALKMTIAEEIIHSTQIKLHEINKKAIQHINYVNEEIAKLILNLDNNKITKLSKYLNLEPVPEEFPTAKKANLFFNLTPDNFIMNALGSNVMNFTKIEIDQKINSTIPQLHDMYMQWLKPIQKQHVVFNIIEGKIKFIIKNILKYDKNFCDYIKIWHEDNVIRYNKKNVGDSLVETCYNSFHKKAFNILINNIPTIKELNQPNLYINRISRQK